jgi:hypothetical protein
VHGLLGSVERLHRNSLAECLRNSRCCKKSLVYYLGDYIAFLCTSSYSPTSL